MRRVSRVFGITIVLAVVAVGVFLITMIIWWSPGSGSDPIIPGCRISSLLKRWVCRME